ncbi:MAG: 50S ribosomal protein L4 [Planctomycetaceae bacterium]
MINVPVVNMAGESVGTYEFDPAELAKGINKQMLHDVCVMYALNQRVGTVRTKARGEVAGSTKKLFKQKGTGNARAGTKRSPTRRHGGHAFAKRPKDWSYRMPRKMLQAATRMALLSKFQDGEAVVLSELKLPEQKTKVVAGVLKALGVSEQTCLLAIKEHDPVVWKCSRNIESLWVSPGSNLNAYDLLHQKRLVITREAMDEIRSRGKVVEAGV